MKGNIDDFDFYSGSFNDDNLQKLKKSLQKTVEKVETMMNSRYFTRCETGQLLGVTSQMVSVYIKKGWIKPIAWKRPYLFREKEINELNARLEAKRNGFYVSTSD